MNSLLGPSAYGWLMLAGILVSIALWSRVAKRDERLVLIYIAALASAFLGAKLVYLGAEGWLHWHDENRWVILATGKSITGALLGGYAAVELAKRFAGYRSPTGDWFAIIAPVGIMLGRIGCVLHGCCLGNTCEPSWFTVNDAHGLARWPAAQVELLFNATALVVVVVLRSRTQKTETPSPPQEERVGERRQTAQVNNAGSRIETPLPALRSGEREIPSRAGGYVFAGQHFHLYLIAYGLFRFAHEFLRETPRVLGPITGYQIAALMIVGLGGAGFWIRQRQPTRDAITSSPSQ